AHGERMVLIARRPEPLAHLTRHLPMAVDARAVDVRRKSDDLARSLLLRDVSQELVVIDCVLHRVGVRAMRQSLAGAAHFIAAMCAECTRANRTVKVVAAGSIAANAWGPFSTSYSAAKRHQERLY